MRVSILGAVLLLASGNRSRAAVWALARHALLCALADAENSAQNSCSSYISGTRTSTITVSQSRGTSGSTAVFSSVLGGGLVDGASGTLTQAMVDGSYTGSGAGRRFRVRTGSFHGHVTEMLVQASSLRHLTTATICSFNSPIWFRFRCAPSSYNTQ